MRHVEELPDSEVWEASGGVRIPLKDMGTTHLLNARNYLVRKIDESAQAEDEFDLDDMVEKLTKLEGEAARRLNIKEEQGSESLPITASMRQAEEDYRKLMGG